ncbi:hypothetical protein SK3146_04273 [Paenibacillus konkukensis]|uniref:Uncharacterized protein n=1 Tax=Paenibacillus konkukensis TaxID=2020716 RepID=A0ABY4RS24_9BACL|nr:hypothetical protein SK3146_04273 [Paenibacillus konkukensis]
MWNWSHVFNQVYFQTCCLQRTDRCFTTCARTFNHNFNSFHAMFHSCFSSRFCSHLRCERSALTGTFEAQVTSTCPGNCITVRICNRYNRIVKRRADMSHSRVNIFPITTFRTNYFFRFSHYLVYPPLLFFLVSYSTTRTFTRTSVSFSTLTTNR